MDRAYLAVALIVALCLAGIGVCLATYEHRPQVPVDRYPWDDTPTPTPPTTTGAPNATVTTPPSTALNGP